MDIWHSCLLGIIQGISEFLPISSSAHLILGAKLIGNFNLPMAWNVAFHLGTLLSVLCYFWRDWWKIIIGLRFFKSTHQTHRDSRTLLTLLLVGSIPAGCVGLLWKEDIEAIFHNHLSIVAPLFIVGILLWLGDLKFKTHKKYLDLSLKGVLIIGAAQACALVPGVSRSGATMLAGRALSLSREQAARFSFLLGTPAMAGAAILHISKFSELLSEPGFITAIVVSFVTGLGAIWGLLRLISRIGFWMFALYRAFLSMLILVWM
mgnify:CR=1 FL=1